METVLEDVSQFQNGSDVRCDATSRSHVQQRTKRKMWSVFTHAPNKLDKLSSIDNANHFRELHRPYNRLYVIIFFQHCNISQGLWTPVLSAEFPYRGVLFLLPMPSLRGGAYVHSKYTAFRFSIQVKQQHWKMFLKIFLPKMFLRFVSYLALALNMINFCKCDLR